MAKTIKGAEVTTKIVAIITVITSLVEIRDIMAAILGTWNNTIGYDRGPYRIHMEVRRVSKTSLSNAKQIKSMNPCHSDYFEKGLAAMQGFY